MNEEKTKLPKIFNKNSVLPPVYKRYSREEVEKIIEENYGIITVICAILDCSARQFYIAVDKWGLRDHLKEAKS